MPIGRDYSRQPNKGRGMKRSQGDLSIRAVWPESADAIRWMLLAGAASPAMNRAIVPPHAVVGVNEAQLDARFWIARAPHATKTVRDARTISEQNSRLLKIDPSTRD